MLVMLHPSLWIAIKYVILIVEWSSSWVGVLLLPHLPSQSWHSGRQREKEKKIEGGCWLKISGLFACNLFKELLGNRWVLLANDILVWSISEFVSSWNFMGFLGSFVFFRVFVFSFQFESSMLLQIIYYI